MSAERPLVIVFGHPDGILPNPWYRAYKRVKRAMRRAAYHATVELRPVARLPAPMDVLVVEPTLGIDPVMDARATEVVRAEAEEVQAAIDRIVEGLVASGRLTHAPPASREIAVHIGFQPVGERARIRE